MFAVMPAVGILVQPIWGVARRSQRTARAMLVVISLGDGAGMLAIGRAHGFASILAATALLRGVRARGDPDAALGEPVRARGSVRTRSAGCARSARRLRRVDVRRSRRRSTPIQASRGLAATPGAPTGPGPRPALSDRRGALGDRRRGALAIPNRGAVALRAHRGEWKVLLRNPRFVRLLAVCTLAFLFVNGPMELFPILVRERGGDLGSVRDMWLFMLVPGDALVAVLGTLCRAARCARDCSRSASSPAAARWLLAGMIESLPRSTRCRCCTPSWCSASTRRAALRRRGGAAAAALDGAVAARHRRRRDRRDGVEPARGLAARSRWHGGAVLVGGTGARCAAAAVAALAAPARDARRDGQRGCIGLVCARRWENAAPRRDARGTRTSEARAARPRASRSGCASASTSRPASSRRARAARAPARTRCAKRRPARIAASAGRAATRR